MSVPLEPLNRLVEGATTLRGRLLLTAGLLALFAMVGWIGVRFTRRVTFDSENVERAIMAGVALGLFLLTIVVGSALLALWNLSPLEALGIGDPVLVLGQIVITVALFLGVYVVTGALKRVVHDFAQDRTSISRHQTELIYRTTQVSVFVLAFLVVFSVWGVNLGGLLVGAGFLGIVVGLAARQTLGSLIAGFVLMFARPFEIGDWVRIGEREGIVTEISIVNTRIQTFDGEYAMIPNDTVGASEVINRTRKGRLRIHLGVGVDYETDLEAAIEVAESAMKGVEEVLAVPQPQAVLEAFGDSAIDLDLRFWIDKPSARRKWRAQTAVVAAVKGAFDEAGIKIPYPQRELMGRSEEGGFRVDSGPRDRRGRGDGATDGERGGEGERPGRGTASSGDGQPPEE